MRRTSALEAERPDLTGCRVLLVEDEYFIADDLSQALTACGADVIGPVPSLEKAKTLAESERLTCAVLDINLRGENGFEVADMLQRRNVPFVYCTGYQASTVPENLRGAMHLEKPFRVEDLLRILAGICGSKIKQPSPQPSA